MTGRVKIIRVTTEIKEGRKEPTTEVFYECWCDVQSLGTNEKYTALQAGLENTIVFKVRNCKRMKEVRKKMKEFYAEYDGTRFDIYDASPMFTDNGWDSSSITTRRFCGKASLSPRNRSQSVSQKEVFQRRNMNTSREKNIPVVK